jgi:hypothetical protein
MISTEPIKKVICERLQGVAGLGCFPRAAPEYIRYFAAMLSKEWKSRAMYTPNGNGDYVDGLGLVRLSHVAFSVWALP